MAKPNSLVLAAALALTVCIVLLPSAGASTITCEKVAMTVASTCFKYIQVGGAMPPAACCESAGNLIASAAPEKQQACGCLKDFVRTTPGMSADNLASIPAKCGVNGVGFVLAQRTDCSKLK